MKRNPSVQMTSEQPTRRHFLHRAGSVVGAAGLASTFTRQAKGRPVGANDRIGIGFIGCGGRGGNHLDMVKILKDGGAKVEIVAVCDVYRPRMDKQAAIHKAKAYSDHRELLADSNVDAVVIATPDHIHGFQVIDAVQAGKDVYCEKPVTHWRQFELTKKMVAEIKKTGRVFQLGSQGMSNPAWELGKTLIKEGLIGQPIHAESGYFRVGDYGEAGMPIDDPNAKPGDILNWEAFLGDAPKRPFEVSRFFRWRLYEDYSGGPATDLYPHCLTPMIDMLGVGMPGSVVGSGGKYRYFACKEREVPDSFNLFIDYPEKLTVAVLGTQGNNNTVLAELGSVGRSPVIRGWEGTLVVWNNEIAFIPAEGSSKKARKFPINGTEDFKRHWEDFLTCCRTRGTPRSHAELTFRVQTALQMAILGWRAGKTARFDFDKQEIVV